MAGSKGSMNLTSLPSEVRALIFDRVFSSNTLSFRGPCYEPNSQEWPLGFMRTCRLFHTEGKAALRRSFLRTTICYEYCLPISPEQLREDDIGEAVQTHYDFVRQHAGLFQKLDISGFDKGSLYHTDFPNLKSIVSDLYGFGHRPGVHGSGYRPQDWRLWPEERIVAEWHWYCQNLLSDPRVHVPISGLIRAVVDKIDPNRPWKLFVRILMSDLMPGHESMMLFDVDETRVIKKS